MKDMLSFLIARDTMHQNQWLAVLEELGGLKGVHPIPNSFPQGEENQNFNYTFMSTTIHKEPSKGGRWAEGPSMDGKGEFKFTHAEPHGEEPILGPPIKEGHAQKEQMRGAAQPSGSITDKIKDKIKK